MNSDFFQKIFKIYSNIKINKKNKEFYQLDNIVYYQADKANSRITAKNNIFEIDIHSAFPTICNHLFDKNNPFLIKLNSFKEKLERNIFISTTLKDTGYLKQLNYISKMVISSVLMDEQPDADILELKKDGIVYCGNSVIDGKLYNYFQNELGFNIRISEYNKYIRVDRTSYFVDDNVTIKGIFKDRPDFLSTITNKILLSEDINFSELNKIYSNKYFEIIRENNLDEIFLKYYACDNKKYLTSRGKYDKIKAIYKCDILPKEYLKIFIYPLLLE